MFVIVSFAFIRANVTDLGADLEHGAQSLDILARATDRQSSCRIADVGAV